MLTALSCVLSVAVLGAGAPAWEEVDKDDGITVWARAVPGSEVREVKAEMVVRTSPEKLMGVLDDIPHYTEFMPYVEEAFLIHKEPDGSGHIEYARIDPPLVDERDYTVRVKYKNDPEKGLYKRSWAPANKKGPPKQDGVVRVEVNKGYWIFKKSGENKTWVQYYLYTHPGGSIPMWIVNKANTTSVPDLMKALKSRAQPEVEALNRLITRVSFLVR